jgi:hypothetical protein
MKKRPTGRRESKSGVPAPRVSAMLDDFMDLSRVLTGVANLDAKLGRQYVDRLNSGPLQPQLREVLDKFHGLKKGDTLFQQVKEKIVATDDLRGIVCQIILLWYTSLVQDNLDLKNPPASASFSYGTQEEYFSGLVWQIIGAHPPGLSGGYFGHWRYRPENEPK